MNAFNRCTGHGAVQDRQAVCATYRVLNEVEVERRRQFDKYGENLENYSGTGPSTRWIPGSDVTAKQLERLFRSTYDATQAEGLPVTFLQLVLEEVAEAFMEDDPDRLAEELVQVAALCVSWVEKIRYDVKSPCNPAYVPEPALF